MQIQVNERSSHIFEPGGFPELFYAGNISNEPEWSFGPHSHDDLSEIIYISDGEGEYIIDGQYYKASKGDLLIYNKNVIHEEKSNPKNPIKTYFCGLGNLHINGLPTGFIIPGNRIPVIHTDQYSYKVENYISNIFEECKSQVVGYDIVCQNLLVSLIILIYRMINIREESPNEKSAGSVGMKIKGYLDENYTRDISLRDIAGTLYISQDYISHIFKSEIGKSPIRYLITRRIGEAKKLLLTTDKTIHEIAASVGYDNPNYFMILFKKVTGTSPGVFRKNNRG